MYQHSRQTNKRKKVFVVLIVASILGNILLVTPTFARANGQHTPARSDTGWTIWSLYLLTPTPTPVGTFTPTPTPVSTFTPTPTPTPVDTPGPHATGTPQVTPTPTPTKPPIRLAAATSFTIMATQIVGTDAHLSLADPAFPVLTFVSVTIQGMKISHLSLTFSASGIVTGRGVAIKTSVFREFVSALASFTDQADLLILLAGGTVHTLTMRNVSLQIDRYINMQSITIQGLQQSFVA